MNRYVFEIHYIIDNVTVFTYFTEEEEELINKSVEEIQEIQVKRNKNDEEKTFITESDNDIIKNLCNINIQIVSYLKDIRAILDIELLKYNFYYKIDDYFYKTNNTNKWNNSNNIYS